MFESLVDALQNVECRSRYELYGENRIPSLLEADESGYLAPLKPGS